eukprot:7448410-Alexandrium_andersonii.AAC.1
MSTWRPGAASAGPLGARPGRQAASAGPQRGRRAASASPHGARAGRRVASAGNAASADEVEGTKSVACGSR